MSTEKTEGPVSRATDTSSVWLNDVFRFRDSPFRLWKRGPRLSGLDVFFIVLLAVLWNLIWFSVRAVLKTDLFIFLDPINIILVSLLVGWFGGRRITYISPLRKKTGEGLGPWLNIQAREARARLGHQMGTRQINYYKSYVNGEVRDVEAVEYIGTMPAPSMPHRDSRTGQSEHDVILYPRGVAYPWRKNNTR